MTIISNIKTLHWTSLELDELPELVRPLFSETQISEKFPGWKIITTEEFAQSSFWTYSPFAMIDKTLYDPNIGHITYKCFLFYDGRGYGMTHHYWKKTVEFVRFGCQHDMQFIENLGRCYNRYKCSKCGYQQDIDSSD